MTIRHNLHTHTKQLNAYTIYVNVQRKNRDTIKGFYQNIAVLFSVRLLAKSIKIKIVLICYSNKNIAVDSEL